MEIALKPCPFCGGAVEIMDYVGLIQNDNKHRFSIWCDSCELAFGYDEDYGGMFSTQEKAAAAWNRRADDTGWIPVSERLPEYGTPVLAYAPKGNVVFVGKYAKADGYWHDKDAWCVINAQAMRAPEMRKKVTHWRPLPAPPVEKEKEESQ